MFFKKIYHSSYCSNNLSKMFNTIQNYLVKTFICRYIAHYRTWSTLGKNIMMYHIWTQSHAPYQRHRMLQPVRSTLYVLKRKFFQHISYLAFVYLKAISNNFKYFKNTEITSNIKFYLKRGALTCPHEIMLPCSSWWYSGSTGNNISPYFTYNVK